MSVSCCVDEPQFLETCLVAIVNVVTCHKLVCWCVGNMTMSWVTDDGIHRWHASFVLALHMSCHGILPTRDHDWLPVMVSTTLKMSSEIWLRHVSGWHVAKMSTTFPTTGLENHTHCCITIWTGWTKGCVMWKSHLLIMDSDDPWRGYHQIESRDRDFDDNMDTIVQFKWTLSQWWASNKTNGYDQRHRLMSPFAWGHW